MLLLSNVLRMLNSLLLLRNIGRCLSLNARDLCLRLGLLVLNGMPCRFSYYGRIIVSHMQRSIIDHWWHWPGRLSTSVDVHVIR